jgi:uncharacterized protein (TIGR03067 family)
LFCSAAGAFAEDTAASELQKLQGAWVVTAAELEGQAFADARGAKLTFEKDLVTMEMTGRKVTANCKLNPAEKPRQIDLVPTKERADEPPMAGIYAWDGEQLRLLFSGNKVEETTDGNDKTVRKVTAGKRPTAMDSKQGLLLTLKRKASE